MRKILIVFAAIVAAVYVWNASWRVSPPANASVRLIAHRGVHQTYSREGLTNDTCTAERIFAPTHTFLENTIPSMQAAFDAGADIVELDVHPTTDGQLAVLHDWTVDCRTNGKGVTREQTMAVLKALDIGHGYTADGGRTFPFRGKGVGLMPTLPEVLVAVPGRLLVNFKSNEAREGDMLAAVAAENLGWQEAVWGVYGGDAPTARAASLIPGARSWTRRGLVHCMTRYMALGWTGYVPEACRDTMVMVPVNIAPWLWGWPNLFQQRMRGAGSDIILLGPYGAGDPGTAGIDSAEEFARVPAAFDGYVWTNRIELIGPLARRGSH
ncbi:glycerophosphodiester phosphodiesterase family protein [Arvimicrobium flavum]|uniref:glycerophosphodiester phosphodiesterase family protein n=1 Tax=Arvimicrobium flavum TaxID=3393320 RepID=UPI00237C17DB|nr:glycerophosphodiester phosphodiesterase family protein [Mesorhizobium shangrilense]